jgi:hypothetical protein
MARILLIRVLMPMQNARAKEHGGVWTLVVAAALSACSSSQSEGANRSPANNANAHDSPGALAPTPSCPPGAQQTTLAFDCYTLAELQQIAEAAARDGGRAQGDAAAESDAAGAGGDAGASATGPLLLSCPWPDGNIYPPLSGFLDTPPPGDLPVSMPGECCYYRIFSFCAGL